MFFNKNRNVTLAFESGFSIVHIPNHCNPPMLLRHLFPERILRAVPTMDSKLSGKKQNVK